MEEIVHAFGIDGRLIAIQMINFAILLGALSYFLYTPVLTMLREREAKIKQGIEDAERARLAKEEAAQDKVAVLKEARVEAESILAQGKTRAEEKAAGIIHDAEAKALRVLEDARARSEEEHARRRKESEADIAQAAILAAEAMLKKQ